MTDQPCATTAEGSTASDRPLDLLALARLMLAETSLGTDVIPQEESPHHPGSREDDVQHSASQASSSSDVGAQVQLVSEASGTTASAMQSRGTNEEIFSEPVAPALDLSTGPGLMNSSSVDANPAAIQLRAIVTAIDGLPDFWKPSGSSLAREAVLGINPQAAWSHEGVHGGAALSSSPSDPNQAAEKRPSSESATDNHSDARPSNDVAGVVTAAPATVPATISTQPILSVLEPGRAMAASTINEVDASPIELPSALTSAVDALIADATGRIGLLHWNPAQAIGSPSNPVNDVGTTSHLAGGVPVIQQEADQAATAPEAEISAPLPPLAEVATPDLGSAVEAPPVPKKASTTDSAVSDLAPPLTGSLGSPVPPLEKAGSTPSHVGTVTPAGPVLTPSPAPGTPPTAGIGGVSPPTPGAPGLATTPVGGADPSPSIVGAKSPTEASIGTPVGSGSPASGNNATHVSTPDASQTSSAPSGLGVTAPVPVGAPGVPNGVSAGTSPTAANDASPPPASRAQVALPDLDYPVAGDVQYDGSAPEISPALRATILDWLNTARADLPAEVSDAFALAPQMSYLDVLLADSVSVEIGQLEATAPPASNGAEPSTGPAEPFSQGYDAGLS